MEPTLRSGDLVVTLRQREYAVGDVVAFPVEGGIVIHRIVGGTAEGGYVTRGDNRDADDLWRPTSQQVLGRMQLRVPGAGLWVERLRRPEALALLTAGLALLAFSGSLAVPRRRRRMSQRAKTLNPLFWPGWPLGMGVVGLLLLVAGGWLAANGFWKPTQEVRKVERVRYEHRATFGYTLRVEPSTLYPEGLMGPVSAGQDLAGRQLPPKQGQPAFPQGPAVYTKEPRDMIISFHYSLMGPARTDLIGNFSADLNVQAGENGWLRTITLVPRTAFEGPNFSAAIAVDLGQVMEMIASVEKQTDYKPNFYQLTVLPRVELHGRIAGDTVDESYSPPFRMLWERNRLVPDGDLTRSESRLLWDEQTVVVYVPLGPAAVPVIAARAAGIGLSLLGVLALGIAGVRTWHRVRQDEALRIRARYRGLIVDVQAADLPSRGQTVVVSSMGDLARIARAEGRQIFHARADGQAEIYFLPDGAFTYEYRPDNVSQREK
jgi:hypothetical protein